MKKILDRRNQKREAKAAAGTTESQEGDRAEGLKLAQSIRSTLGKLDKQVKIVAKEAREKNTKKEIKVAATAMSSLMSQITTNEAKTLLRTLGTKNTGAQAEVERVYRAAQEDRISKLENKLEEVQKEKEKLIEEEVADLNWPDLLFKNVSMVNGSPIQAKEADILVLEEQGAGRNKETREALIERYPELKEMKEKMCAVAITTKAVGKEGTILTEKWVVKAEVGNGEKDWYDAALEIKRILKEGDREKIAIYPPEGDQGGDKTRKMWEFILRNSNIKCLLYGKQAKNSERSRNTDVLFLKQEGATYADLLKTVKEKVGPNTEGGRAIKTIRETKGGVMMVVLNNENKEAVRQINNDIGGQTGIKIVKGKGRGDVAVNIYGIDGLTTAEEVKEAVSGETGAPKENINVGQLRNMARGNQAITVHLPRDAADKLLAKGGVKVGLSWCPTKQRVEVTRCYNAASTATRGESARKAWTTADSAGDVEARATRSRSARSQRYA